MRGCACARAPLNIFMVDYTSKARYWMAIMYPENMIDNWEHDIANLLQVPYCYIIHNKDVTQNNGQRKIHVHVLICFGNTTTYNTAMAVFKTLQADDKPTCIPNDIIKQVRKIRRVYDYFIHDTDDCRVAGKHLYNSSERIEGNCFDIGAYEQIDQEEKEEFIRSIESIIFDNTVTNFADLVLLLKSLSDYRYMVILRQNNSYFRTLISGMYHKMIVGDFDCQESTGEVQEGHWEVD